MIRPIDRRRIPPNSWRIPLNWHEDFKQIAETELDAIKAFSLVALESCPTLSFELDLFEEGYLKVNFFHSENRLGAIYANDTQSGIEFSLYISVEQADEEEHHFLTIDEGLKILRRHL
ncbi:MAG: hypothetical protein P1V19_08410 [Gimesia sp.]|nr:hypothetical protein [Gimesia sp.]